MCCNSCCCCSSNIRVVNSSPKKVETPNVSPVTTPVAPSEPPCFDIEAMFMIHDTLPTQVARTSCDITRLTDLGYRRWSIGDPL